MITWIRLEPGDYISMNNRFHIIKTYDIFYGNHWRLQGTYEKEYHKSLYYEYSLRDCKAKAETLLKASV